MRSLGKLSASYQHLSNIIWIFVQTLVTFHNLGALLGRLAPRCTDPNAAVRRAATDCIYSLLHIQLRYEGNTLYYNKALCIIRSWSCLTDCTYSLLARQSFQHWYLLCVLLLCLCFWGIHLSYFKCSSMTYYCSSKETRHQNLHAGKNKNDCFIIIFLICAHICAFQAFHWITKMTLLKVY